MEFPSRSFCTLPDSKLLWRDWLARDEDDERSTERLRGDLERDLEVFGAQVWYGWPKRP